MRWVCVLAILAAGCSSRPVRPGPDREVVPLAEYIKRERRPDRIPPVVLVPAEARLRLRISPHPAPENMLRVIGPFEQVDDIVVTVRAKKPFQMDMKNLDCWVEGEWYGPLPFYSFVPHEGGLTFTDASGAELNVPVRSTTWISAELPGPR